MGLFMILNFFMNFWGILLILFGIFNFIFFLSLYFININSDKNKFLIHDSYFKSALKYLRSNLGNQQGDWQWTGTGNRNQKKKPKKTI